MTDLGEQVRRLLLDEGCSSTEAARRLKITPAEVVSIASRSKGRRNGATKTQPRNVEPLSEVEQIHLLRNQVRQGLISRTGSGLIGDFPAAALVRLWQLIEDPQLLGTASPGEEDPFNEVIPKETQEAIFRLLDGDGRETID
jgi:hypothetical protein